jgi:hypothetical protein
MQNSELLAKRPPGKQHRFHQDSQISEIGNELLDARLKLNGPYHTHFETEIT